MWEKCEILCKQSKLMLKECFLTRDEDYLEWSWYWEFNGAIFECSKVMEMIVNKIVYVHGLKTILGKIVIDNSMVVILSFKRVSNVRTLCKQLKMMKKLDFRL